MKASPLVHGRRRLHSDLVLEVCKVQHEQMNIGNAVITILEVTVTDITHQCILHKMFNTILYCAAHSNSQD